MSTASGAETYIHELSLEKIIIKEQIGDNDFTLRIILGIDPYRAALRKDFATELFLECSDGEKYIVVVDHGREGNINRKITFKNCWFSHTLAGSCLCKSSAVNGRICAINNNDVLDVSGTLNNDKFTVEVINKLFSPALLNDVAVINYLKSKSSTFKSFISQIIPNIQNGYFISPSGYITYEISND